MPFLAHPFRRNLKQIWGRLADGLCRFTRQSQLKASGQADAAQGAQGIRTQGIAAAQSQLTLQEVCCSAQRVDQLRLIFTPIHRHGIDREIALLQIHRQALDRISASFATERSDVDDHALRIFLPQHAPDIPCIVERVVGGTQLARHPLRQATGRTIRCDIPILAVTTQPGISHHATHQINRRIARRCQHGGTQFFRNSWPN